MARIAGIQIEKNNKGVFTKLHVDLKKFAEDDDIIDVDQTILPLEATQCEVHQALILPGGICDTKW